MIEKELFIIRHGETDFNRSGVVQGRGVDPPLNEVGKKQAQQFFLDYSRSSFEIIYTSTLKRTHQTVQSFIDLNIPWKKTDALDEISWGLFEGQPVTNEFRIAYKKLVVEWQKGNMKAKAPGGESPEEVQDRQRSFIERLISSVEKKILICMHGRAMRILLSTLIQKRLTSMDDYPHHNLTLYKLNYHMGKFSIEQFNDRWHLHHE